MYERKRKGWKRLTLVESWRVPQNRTVKANPIDTIRASKSGRRKWFTCILTEAPTKSRWLRLMRAEQFAPRPLSYSLEIRFWVLFGPSQVACKAT